MKEGKILKVLLVDDDHEDIELTSEVMEMSKIVLDIEEAHDGQEAIDMLTKTLSDDPGQLPDLIMLDLNMPRKNGHETLQELKTSDDFRHIPVVVLTTSKAESDIVETYKNGVSCYITKPVGLKEFQKVVEAVNNFWFTVVKYPEK